MSAAARRRRVYLALGSNLGDREAHLRAAVRGLREGGVSVDAVSSLYETPPWGVTSQPAFLNAAVGGWTALAPCQLLDLAKRLEAAAGRDFRAPRWTARPLDVDLALIEGERVDEPDLVVPHALLTERSFVLVPLAEIAGEVRHPLAGLGIAALRDLRPPAERREVRRVAGPGWEAATAVLREAAEADLPAVRDLLRRVYVGGGYSEASAFEATLERLAFDGRTVGLVALDGEAVAGFALYLLPGSPFRQVGRRAEVEMRLLAVDPGGRGSGVGACLVRAAITRARADGARAVVLSTQPSMRVAHRLYQGLGFQRASERDWAPASGRSMRVYTLALG